MIDAIDALLDKMDIFLEAFGGSFQWFLWLCGALVVLILVMIGFMVNMLGRMKKLIRHQQAQQELIRQLLEAQLRQNRITAQANGLPEDASDAPGQNPANLRDQY